MIMHFFYLTLSFFFFFFFFQAEDGIRDVAVTGVQTCALPISCVRGSSAKYSRHSETVIPTSLPVETIALTPTFRSNARFTTMPASAPLWDATPSGPAMSGSRPPAGEKVSGTRSQQLMNPSIDRKSTRLN